MNNDAIRFKLADLCKMCIWQIALSAQTDDGSNTSAIKASAYNAAMDLKRIEQELLSAIRYMEAQNDKT